MAVAARMLLQRRKGEAERERAISALAARAHATLTGVTLEEAYAGLVARGVARGTLESVGEQRAVYAIAAELELQTLGPTERRSGSGRLNAAELNAWAALLSSIVRCALSRAASSIES